MTGKWKTEDIKCIKEHLDNIERALVRLRDLLLYRYSASHDDHSRRTPIYQVLADHQERLPRFFILITVKTL